MHQSAGTVIIDNGWEGKLPQVEGRQHVLPCVKESVKTIIVLKNNFKK